MKTFTDRFGNQWTLDIAVPEIKAVREALGINLFDAFAGDYGLYSEIISDPEKLVAVAYVLCRDQVAAKAMTAEEFGHGMAGDALRALGDAFGEALVDFFPNARARELVRATLQKMRELVELRASVLAEAVNQLRPEDLLLARPRSGSTSVPESLDATRAG